MWWIAMQLPTKMPSANTMLGLTAIAFAGIAGIGTYFAYKAFEAQTKEIESIQRATRLKDVKLLVYAQTPQGTGEQYDKDIKDALHSAFHRDASFVVL